MPDPTLEFLRNEAGEKEGLADAGIETFRDAPYASCAREAGQNTRDAAEHLPVRMRFNLMSVDQGQFPGYSQLLSALEACSANAEQEKEREFFANALAVARQASIPVLEIADYNTKGLIGPPDEPGTPFHSLLKASGVSAKNSDTAGGSFGIGKNASFAVSDLQMVFYSTSYNVGDGREAAAAQGKVKLVSHIDGARTPRRATGYWGHLIGFSAVTDPAEIPVWMRRQERGTSIFCMGVRETQDWAEHMTSSLVSNFFTAIHRNEMVFEVGTAFRLNANTVEALLTDDRVRAAADNSGHLPDLEFAEDLYRCLVSPNAEESTVEIDGLGTVKLRILSEEGLPRRIGFIRNGMLITDNLRYFGHPLARFPGSRDFVALVEPADDAASRLLKRLENPAHDNLSAQRISDPAKRGATESAMRKLGRRLREAIRAGTGVSQQESVVLDELARFFAESGRSNRPPDPNAEPDPETFVFVPPMVRERQPGRKAAEGGDEGGSARRGTGGGGTGGGAGPGRGSGSGGSGSQGTRKSIPLVEVRNLIRTGATGEATSRRVLFTPGVAGPLQLRFQANGINAAETLRLTHSDAGTIQGDELVLRVAAGERQNLVVTFDQPYEGPLELIGIQDENRGEDAP